MNYYNAVDLDEIKKVARDSKYIKKYKISSRIFFIIFLIASILLLVSSFHFTFENGSLIDIKYIAEPLQTFGTFAALYILFGYRRAFFSSITEEAISEKELQLYQNALTFKRGYPEGLQYRKLEGFVYEGNFKDVKERACKRGLSLGADLVIDYQEDSVKTIRTRTSKNSYGISNTSRTSSTRYTIRGIYVKVLNDESEIVRNCGYDKK